MSCNDRADVAAAAVAVAADVAAADVANKSILFTARSFC